MPERADTVTTGVPAVVPVIAFVDWYSLLVEVDEDEELEVRERAGLALRTGIRRIESVLDEDYRFRLRLRLYGGWTKGITRSDFYSALLSTPAYRDLDSQFKKSFIDVHPEIEFGDRLLIAMPQRLNVGLGINLPNTLRQQSGRRRRVEKMVDTALASDVIHWATDNPQGWTIIVSNDDDMIPPALTAEALHFGSGGRVIVARSSKRGDSRFLALEGLLR